VLLLDEPTAVLTPPEVDACSTTVRSMTADGKAVVFISHKLGEVMAVSDRVTVMRDGRVTGVVDATDTDPPGSSPEMMVGRDVDLTTRRAVSPSSGTACG
jgi:general nucleoside transport system ATP-binding protein